MNAADAPQWVHITGTVVFEDNQGAKDAIFTLLPQLKEMYAKELDHFTVFYLKDAKASIYGIEGKAIEELAV